MSSVILARTLGKTYTVHEQQPGLAGALRSFVHRERIEKVAVTDLDLDVPAGQIIGLLGPNGAGKTTSIKMFSGLIRPTTGTLEVLGHQPARRSFEFLRSISVVLGQKSMLWWDVPAHDSLLVHRQMYDLTKAEFDASVSELADLLEVTDLLHTPVRKLSLGQRMRCELLLALLHKPKLLFADEPTIGLDVVAKATLRAILARANAELGTTIVLTSHDMDDVEALCERIVLIDHGRLRYDGDVAGLRATVRPGKQVQVSFVDAPRLPERLPAGVELVESDERSLTLDVAREQVGTVMAEVATWGAVADLQVADADLDAVMAEVYGS